MTGPQQRVHLQVKEFAQFNLVMKQTIFMCVCVYVCMLWP